MALKDCSAVRREKQSIEHENEFLRTEIERMAQQQQDEDGHNEPKDCRSFSLLQERQESPRYKCLLVDPALSVLNFPLK